MKGLIAVLAGMTSLSHDDARERPVDRLGAAGFGGRVVPDQTREGANVERASHELRQAHLSSLGVDLIRYKFSGAQGAGSDAEDKLSLILGWPTQWAGRKVGLNAAQRDAVACWAIHEWAKDKCPPRPEGCGGAREVPSAEAVQGAQPMMDCPKCKGTGVRLWTNEERVEAMGDVFAVGMDSAHRIIAHAESLAVRTYKKMLEKW